MKSLPRIFSLSVTPEHRRRFEEHNPETARLPDNPTDDEYNDESHHFWLFNSLGQAMKEWMEEHEEEYGYVFLHCFYSACSPSGGIEMHFTFPDGSSDFWTPTDEDFKAVNFFLDLDYCLWWDGKSFPFDPVTFHFERFDMDPEELKKYIPPSEEEFSENWG